MLLASVGGGRDAAKHPAVCWTVPAIKHYPGQNVNRAEIAKPCIEVSELLVASCMKWK